MIKKNKQQGRKVAEVPQAQFERQIKKDQAAAKKQEED